MDNKNRSSLVFTLANELQRYIEQDADRIDRDVWDSINHWRVGILSQGEITEEDLSEIIGYIGAEKLQELIAIASYKATS